jgi:hypothetical protein
MLPGVFGFLLQSLPRVFLFSLTPVRAVVLSLLRFRLPAAIANAGLAWDCTFYFH